MPRAPREIPWLEQRNGVYNVRWYEPPTAAERQRNPQAKGQTKRLGLRTRDPGEAQTRFAAFLATGYHKATADGQLTVAAALDQYDREHVDKRVVDKQRARQAQRYLTEFFGDTPLTAIGIPECRTYTEARTGGKINGGAVSASSARRELVTLRAAAHHALRWKRIAMNEMPTFELPPEDDDGQAARWFTKDELDRLLSHAEGRTRDFVVLAYGWGARRESVAQLEVRQVQLEKGLVNLQKPGQQVTKKRRPIVPIFPSQREVVERLISEAGDGWLFGKGYSCYRPFRELCEACGIDEERRNPHMLRHSRATHMLMDGESIYKVARLLGDTVATVERVYGHYSPEYLAS